MDAGKVNPKFITVIMVTLFFAVALSLRVYFPYDRIFVGDWIKFASNDAYYHMRLVDNLVHNFPLYTAFDPYRIYPGGAGVDSISFFDWLLAGIIWVIGLGSPTEHTIDVVGVYFPAVLGALTVIPVYFIGKELFGHWAGVLSSGLIALLPGEFLGRSILGFTDQHVAETLFMTTTILFLILALKTASRRQLTFSHLRRQGWATSARPLIYSLLAGIFFGVYLLTWLGALLFVFIISIYFIIQFIIDHLKHKSTDYLCLVGIVLFFIAAIMFLPFSPGMLYRVAVVGAFFIPPALWGVSRLMASKPLKPAYYPLVLVGLGAAGLAIFSVINPSLFSSMLRTFSIFKPTGASLTTIEMQPFLFPTGKFSLVLAWGNFTTGFFLSIISLFILGYLAVKQGNAEKSLLVVWSLIILAATLGQRRFAYYFAVNVTLLTSYLTWQILRRVNPEESSHKAEKAAGEAGRRKGGLKKGGFSVTVSRINMALAVLIAFLIVFFPNIAPAAAAASQARFTPSDAWVSSLAWMRENTPDPFGNPNFYYELQEAPPREEDYQYPDSAYGVLAWWDYGYWISRIAHRIPNANPSQAAEAVTSVASFFTAQDEQTANEIARELGSDYVIIDYEAAYVNPQTASGKFWAIAIWAGKEPTEFFDVYLRPQQENRLVPQMFFYPEYYRSLASRLYNFDGQAVVPKSTAVIAYQERANNEGTIFKIITGLEQFDSYQAAEDYLSSRESGNYRIVSADPFISPVPLEALENYRLIYSSSGLSTLASGEEAPAIKIFEHTN